MDTDFDVEQPLTPAGERLVTAAAELFYRRGIRAVGVDLIADSAGTTKKTLYDRFGSKDALVALYLRRRARRWQVFVGEYLERTPPGRGRVLAVFDALEERLADQDRGCAFVNAHAEIGGTDHPGVTVVRAEKAAMRALFTAQVQALGLPDAERLGGQLHVLYEGANVAVTAGGQADAIEHARAAAARLLEG
ncbi:TetR/AcrR family transcriptional regulator [Pseudonocardia sp. MH-G8]|uniref:TetR/AcrR family transcriptional regulator n=1 Tax=Pseudonocardia sp. MH-G8 TaxID=1854588 RepID=UPI000B9FEB6F|nr:TetR/AcrR family transcriptional regulator [Pseudonocardia sp. MH-G8]OZM81105.1 TetR family transcriptional regulator [Pseudonocardia sp. MH-G8]